MATARKAKFTTNPRERMWRVARFLPIFSIEDLSSIGTTTRPEAQAFVKCLERRRYVRNEGVEYRARRGRPLAKFRLIVNPGPALPENLQRKVLR